MWTLDQFEIIVLLKFNMNFMSTWITGYANSTHMHTTSSKIPVKKRMDDLSLFLLTGHSSLLDMSEKHMLCLLKKLEMQVLYIQCAIGASWFFFLFSDKLHSNVSCASRGLN